MTSEVNIYLDTSVLFAAVHSESGNARMILKLGEAGAISLWVGPWVLKEIEAVLTRKSPKSKALFALLLDRAQINVGKEAPAATLDKALSVVDYVPDAQVLAEALTIPMNYLVSFDRKHLVGNPKAIHLPFPIGTPTDFLDWYRKLLTEHS